MQIVIDQTDFRRLSSNTQSEILRVMSGQIARTPAARRGRADIDLKWREPVDLTPEQAARLVHGMPEDYRRRLVLFARKDGRVRMKDIEHEAVTSGLRLAGLDAVARRGLGAVLQS